jgi:hypothetical protein
MILRVSMRSDCEGFALLYACKAFLDRHILDTSIAWRSEGAD